MSLKSSNNILAEYLFLSTRSVDENPLKLDYKTKYLCSGLSTNNPSNAIYYQTIKLDSRCICAVDVFE